MIIAPVKVKLTLEEYLTYDDHADKKYELVNGQLIEMPPPSWQHLLIAQLLEDLFKAEIKRLKLNWKTGRNDVEVATQGATNTRRPDVILYDRSLITENRPSIIIGIPRLIVEIVSPGEIGHDRDYQTKPLEYQRLGVPEYWIVDPIDQIITLKILFQGTYRDRIYHRGQAIESFTFPELELTVDQVLDAS